jgi:membrane protein YdbS with pleckstrin-like domain
MPDTYVDGERPICVARQHIAIFIPYALVWVAALAVGLGVLQFLDAQLLLALAVLAKLIHHWFRWQDQPGKAWHHFGRHVAFWMLVFGAFWGLLHFIRFPGWLVIIMVVGVLLAFRLLEWYLQTYTLTDKRVISSYGVLTRVSESLGIEKIQHTTLSRGVVARLFGYGDIEILSAGKGQETLKHLSDAETFSVALITAMSGEKPSSVIVERFLPPSYEPGSPHSPPLGYGGTERIRVGSGAAD